MTKRNSQFINQSKRIDMKLDTRNSSHICIKLTIEDLAKKKGQTTKHQRLMDVKSKATSI